jgi:hypothetical protein
MSKRDVLKSIHLAGMLWFVLCIGYILVLALRQAGVNWWIIFSLSGHSALLVFLMISLYLFAIFRGVVRSHKIETEHPLTITAQYAFLYVTSPFLGGLSGCLGMLGESRISQFLLGIALGTLGATFLVWVIVDPLLGVLEMLLLPASRKHRAERLAQAKAQWEKKQKDRENLLAGVLDKEVLARRHWQEALKPQAEKLVELLATDRINFKRAESEAIDIGVKAWQIGGLVCMRQLHEMTMDLYKKMHQGSMFVDYVSTWWDGIGSWRNLSFG